MLLWGPAARRAGGVRLPGPNSAKPNQGDASKSKKNEFGNPWIPSSESRLFNGLEANPRKRNFAPRPLPLSARRARNMDHLRRVSSSDELCSWSVPYPARLRKRTPHKNSSAAGGQGLTGAGRLERSGASARRAAARPPGCCAPGPANSASRSFASLKGLVFPLLFTTKVTKIAQSAQSQRLAIGG